MANVSFSIFALDKTRAAFAGIQRNLGKVRDSTRDMTTGMSRAGLAFVGFSSVASVASQTLRKVREDVEAIPGIPDHVRESVHMFNAALQETQVSVSGFLARGIAGVQHYVNELVLLWAQFAHGKDVADKTRKDLADMAKAARATAITKSNEGSVKSLRDAEKAALQELGKAQREAFRGTEDLDVALTRARATYDSLAESMLKAKGETPEAIQARTNALKGMTDAKREELRIMEQLNDRAREGDQIFQRFGGTMSASFENAVFSGGKLRDMLRDIANDLARLIFRETVTAPLAGWISGGLKSIFRGGKASGGAVSAGTSYKVGENGEEIFTPNVAGRIIPNHKMGATSSAGAVVVNNYNSFSSGLQAAQILPLLDQNRRATIAEIQDLRARRKIA